MGLALLVDPCVEHLVRKVGSGLRFDEHARSRGLDHLIVPARAGGGGEPQATRVLRVLGGR